MSKWTNNRISKTKGTALLSILVNFNNASPKFIGAEHR